MAYTFITPEDYGALGYPNDDSIALQAWAAAVQADPSGHGLMTKTYAHYYPIRINTSSCRFSGLSSKCGTYMLSYGPGWQIAGTETSSLYGTPIRPDGLGLALDFSGNNVNTSIVLSDNPGWKTLNGVTHLMARWWFKPNSIVGPYNIIASVGALSLHDTVQQALRVQNDNGTLRASLNVAGTQVALQKLSAFTPGHLYFLALTYDNTTVRLYIGEWTGPGSVATLADSKAATGPISQAAYEDVIIGPYFGASFLTRLISNGPNGSIQDLNVEASTTGSVGEYTGANFALSNTIWYGYSSNTRAYIVDAVVTPTQNTDSVLTFMSPGLSFLPIIRGTYPASVSGVQLENFNLRSNGMGLYVHGLQDGLLRNLIVDATGHGVYLRNNSYTTRMEGLRIGSGVAPLRNAACLLKIGACWITPANYLKTQGGAFSVVSINSSGAIRDGYLTDASLAAVVASGVGGGGEIHLVDTAISDEGAPGPMTIAALVLDNVTARFENSGCAFGMSNIPMAIYDDNSAGGDVPAWAIYDGWEYNVSTNNPTKEIYRGLYTKRRNTYRSVYLVDGGLHPNPGMHVAGVS